MYQEDARAILGHNQSSKSLLALKNSLSKGYSGFFITSEKLQLKKAIETLLNSKRTLALFYDLEQAINYCKNIQCNPVIFQAYKDISYENLPCILLALPFCWTENIWLLCIKANSNIAKHGKDFILEIPSCLQAAFARSIYDYISTEAILQEQNWFVFDKVLSKYFIRDKAYLSPLIPQDVYDDFVLHCLDCHLIINPNYNKPSFVPYSVNIGDFNLLKANPFSYECK